MARSNASRESSRLLAVVVTVVVIATLYLAKVVLLPLALAILFTFLLAPLITLLERIRLPRIAAILLVILTFGTGVTIMGWAVIGQLIQVTDHLADYKTNIADKVVIFHRTRDTSLTRVQNEVQNLSAQVGISNSDTEDEFQPRNLKAPGSSPDQPLSVQEVGSSKTRMDALHGFFDPLAFLLLVIVFTFFMLLQREDLRNRLIKLTGQSHMNLMTQTMDEAGSRVSRYFSLQLLVNSCYGAIVFAVLHVIGLPHALLWGALAGILRFAPYIGAPIAALLPTLLSMAVFNGWRHTLFIIAFFFLLELTTANFIEPDLYGKHTGLSSLAILVAAVFWTLIWGPIGLILSIPLTVCLAVVGAHVPHMEFLEVLLGDQPAMRPQTHYYQRLLAGDEHEASQVLTGYLKDSSLEDLYDSVLIPALSLSEQDRHRNTLDESTIKFINQTTRELVEELGLRHERQGRNIPHALNSRIAPRTDAVAAEHENSFPLPHVLRNVLCIPVRDDADEIVAVMLAQLLERAGHHAQAISVLSLDEIAVQVARATPDIVFLSALPPYSMPSARNVYKTLRAQQPQLKIIIASWNYTGDELKAAMEISGGEQEQVLITLAQAVSQAGASAPEAPSEESTPDMPMVQA